MFSHEMRRKVTNFPRHTQAPSGNFYFVMLNRLELILL